MKKKDLSFLISIAFLILLSFVVLKSLAPSIFPLYFVYIAVAVAAFWLFSTIDFDIMSLFSTHFYVLSIIMLTATLFIGSVTRGTIRWIPIGPISLQPAELVRPFILLFFANYLTDSRVTLLRFIRALVLLAIPVFLILVQPSLGVSVITVAGFFGILLSLNFDKKYILFGILAILIAIPLFWFLMAPYQKQRVLSFLSPGSDPLGAGYNSLQSTIAAGSGKLFGRGLGRGIQTQLSFLPEKQTDFIFAAISEELGFAGAFAALAGIFVILERLIFYMEHSVSPAARAYLSGLFLTLLVQVFVHVGMNLGLLPITGLPFPLVSAGGSSLLGTMISLGIASGAYKR